MVRLTGPFWYIYQLSVRYVPNIPTYGTLGHTDVPLIPVPRWTDMYCPHQVICCGTTNLVCRPICIPL